MTDLGWRYLGMREKGNILRGIRDGVAYGGPYHVELHPADRCNIDCFFCSTAAIRGTDELPLSRFQELLGEFQQAGTRALRFAGGGEPLFHRKIKDVLRAVVASRIPIENITTNAVLLDSEVAELLIQSCDQVTVSLNAGDAESYATMMRTPARNFDRVLQNIKTLLRARHAAGSKRPVINLQFLVWRENYLNIPRMYELARELDVDTILFSGLSFLPLEQQMNDDEIKTMLRLYEDVIRIDEFRRIENIGTFERDIQGDVAEIVERLSAERRKTGFIRRGINFLRRSDFSLAEKLRHHRRMNSKTHTLAKADEACIIGWYSMLVRSDGTVAPCCILQHKRLGNVFTQSVAEVWNSEAYQRFRAELTEIIQDGERWTKKAESQTVEDVCAIKGTYLCPMKTFYFSTDTSFMPGLETTFGNVRRTQ
jgi:MoaA/NifB/PqqE/SkfB family radical SAM enzyme